MKGFGIYVKNDLLEPKHYTAMGGGAIFLYLWLLDKMTSVNESGVGKVLGGKPVKFEEVKSDLPMPLRSYRRYIERLEATGYINTARAPYGLIITINKAKKIFNRSDVPKVAHPDVPKSVKRSAEFGTSNIRQDKDNTSNSTNVLLGKSFGDETINEMVSLFEQQGIKLKNQRKQRQAAQRVIARTGSREKAIGVVQAAIKAQDDRFAPTIGDLVSLDIKLSDLASYYRKLKGKEVLRV